MKTIYFFLVCCMMPLLLISQNVRTDLTVSPDSLFYNTEYVLSTTISNNTAQPINLVSVQQHCIGCGNWYWWVDFMSSPVPGYIGAGLSVVVNVKAIGGIFDNTNAEYVHSTMEIVSAVGTQYVQIYLNKQLISKIDDKNKTDLTIYPNPSNSVVTFQTDKNSNSLKFVEIYNLMGQLIYSKELTGSNFTMNISSYPSGTYIAKISTTNFNIVRQIFKD